MGESENVGHENHYRSHCSMELEGGREAAIELLGVEIVETAERNLQEIISNRISDDGDTAKRGFKEKWLVSLYTTNFVVKEKKIPKKVPKKNGKKEQVNTGSKKVEKKELPKSLEIKENRDTSQNLINTDSMDSEKNSVQTVISKK